MPDKEDIFDVGKIRQLDPKRARGGGSIAPVLPDVVAQPLPGGAKRRRVAVSFKSLVFCNGRALIEPLTPFSEAPNALSDFVTLMGRATALRVGHSAKLRLGEPGAA